jgi:AcrR family transcriptional regulator
MYSEILSAKAQQSADTREAILDSCRRLFAKHGFSTTSIDDIARAVGITKGADYWHFTSKKEKRFWNRSVRDGGKLYNSRSLRKLLRWPRLETFFACYLKLFTEAPDTCFFLQRILLEQHKEFFPQVARAFAQTARLVSRILDDGKVQGLVRADLDSLVTAHVILDKGTTLL